LALNVISLTVLLSFQYQAKSITPIDDYSSCSISKDLQALAERELRETEEIRNFSINALRDWAISNPRIIKMRLDSNWLLRHLRFKKFSIPMAQEVLERHIVLKQGSYGMKYYNKELDLLQPRIKKILSGNVVCLLPTRDAFGRRIFMLKVSNLKIEARGDFLRDIFTILDIILHFLAEDEETQIRGVQYVIDMSGLGLAYFKAFPVNDLLRVIMNAERVVALRHKGIHFVNFPTFWNLLINIVLKQVSEKLRTRVKFYKNVAELDFIDKKFLPKEYGFGSNESMKELSGELQEAFE